MKVWLALVCCFALIGVAKLITPENLVASAQHFWWIRVIALVAVAGDARRLHFSAHSSGLGKGCWIFWLTLIALPIAAVPWYLTIRESIRDRHVPYQTMTTESWRRT